MSSSSLSTQIGPTSMSDAQATALGLKTYLGNHTGAIAYNGGNTATLTLQNPGAMGTISATNNCDLIPYQTKDGNWRLKFNITISCNSISRTAMYLQIAGIVYATLSGGGGQMINSMPQRNQSVSGGDVTDSYAGSAGNNLIHLHSAGTFDVYAYEGDVRLDSKPTWAY